MKAFFAAIFGLVLWAGVPSTSAHAQNVTCATRPPGDSTNACASTAFVQSTVSGSIPLPTAQIFIGSAGGIAVGQTMSGDCTIAVTGVITCAPQPSAVARFGFDPTGVNNNSTAWNNFTADTSGTSWYFPPGTYRIPCGQYYVFGGNTSFFGAGGSTTFVLDASCNLTGDIFTWRARSGVRLHDFQVNLNSPSNTGAAGLHSLFLFASNTGTAQNDGVDSIIVVGQTGNTSAVTFISGVGQSFIRPYVENSMFYGTGAPGNQSNCVFLSQNGGVVTGGTVHHNLCAGNPIAVDGQGAQVTNNEVTSWQYGPGIQVSSTTSTCYGMIVANNWLHDTTTGVDANNTTHLGIEMDCPQTLIEGNTFKNLGGNAITVFADNATITNNVAMDVAANGPAGGGQCDVAAYCVYQSGVGYNGQNAKFFNNVAMNLATSNIKYGYGEESGQTFNSTLSGNDFTKVATSAYYLPNVSSTNSFFTAGYSKTLTGNNVASLSWTALDTTSFKNWDLKCFVQPAANNAMLVQVGEGAGPTWETAASYLGSGIEITNGTTTQISAATFTGLVAGSAAWNAAQQGIIRVSAGDLSYAGNKKIFQMNADYFNNGTGNYSSFRGMSAWNADNNAITALRVQAGAGNMYGSCTLSGTP